MITKEKQEVLKIISEKLKGQDIGWCLIGSTNLELQGVKVQSRDIDILTDKKGAYRIGELLQEYQTEPVHWKESEKIASHYGKFKIKNVEIEIIGEIKTKNIYQAAHKPKILLKIQNCEIPCMDLKSEYEAYQKLGRKEKAEMIRQKLKTFS